jgi:hypothetical protein
VEFRDLFVQRHLADEVARAGIVIRGLRLCAGDDRSGNKQDDTTANNPAKA